MVKPLEPRALASGRQVIMPSTDILVVGSGPVGLAAALKVAAMGYRVAIVAPATRPDDHRTAALLAGSVDFLESLGLIRFEARFEEEELDMPTLVSLKNYGWIQGGWIEGGWIQTS